MLSEDELSYCEELEKREETKHKRVKVRVLVNGYYEGEYKDCTEEDAMDMATDDALDLRVWDLKHLDADIDEVTIE